MGGGGRGGGGGKGGWEQERVGGAEAENFPGHEIPWDILCFVGVWNLELFGVHVSQMYKLKLKKRLNDARSHSELQNAITMGKAVVKTLHKLVEKEKLGRFNYSVEIGGFFVHFFWGELCCKELRGEV